MIKKSKKVSTSLYANVLKQCLREAGRIHLKYFHGRNRISYKGPADLVTEADKAAEKAILHRIQKQFPDHAFLMEESGQVGGPSDYCWIVDPLDGTVSFAHGLPIASVSIGLEYRGRPLVAGVYDPFRKELFFAQKGKGAYLNDQRLHVSRATKVKDSLLATGFPYDRSKKGRAKFYLSRVEKFLKQCHGIRRLGSAALDMSYVAAGRFDGYWEYNLKPWDAAAGHLIVTEAGGRVTNFSGHRYATSDTSQTLCSNGKIHREMMKSLK